MYGGTSISRDTRVLNNSLPTVLIATPGRLIDHLENLTLGSGRKFGYDVMRNTEILVLDETDRLLDMGFRREIDKIMAYLPKKDKRQTFLFSATIPSDLKEIMSKYMKSNFVEVDCIKDGGNDDGSGTHTNALVDQTYAILPSMEHSIEAVVKLILDAVEKDDKHKLVVFFPTARMVGFYADFFRVGLGIEVSELHSKKSQGARNKTSAQFREAKKGILFTSDVSARGVDYPDVTTVLQFGLPESREQYIHRLGRCGRAGKTGKGMLILAPFEARFLNELKGIEIKKDADAETVISAPLDQKLGGKMDAIFQRIRSGDQQLCTSASQAYQSFLGFYISNIKRLDVRDKAELLEIGNQYVTRVIGMKEIPGLTKKAAKFMGILGMPGVRIVSLENVKNGNNKKVKK
jgi:ATP-dependent RNA helicase MSS116, mitochondrial